MFANNPGDAILPLQLTAAEGAKLYASATADHAVGETILKVVNGSGVPAEVTVDLAGATATAAEATVFTLAGSGPTDENSFATPDRVAPKETTAKVSLPQFSHTFPANSLTVLRMKAN